MPTTEAELATLRRALDLALTLPAPHFGMDRKAMRLRLDEINSLIDNRRLQRSHLPMPRKVDVLQLGDLSGSQFARQREDVMAKLQAHCEALEQATRSAPTELCAALRGIACSDDEAKALLDDAHESWRSFQSGAYKAATVMAGAVLEGLLQQACQRLGTKATDAFRKLHPARSIKSALHFTIDEGLAILRDSGLLSSALTHTARGLKELRNFVHPDLQRRHKRTMRSTHALLAMQALCTLADELAWALTQTPA